MENERWLWFARIKLSLEQIFYRSGQIVAAVNLKPIVPGHVLVFPTRKVTRFSELTAGEVSELWISAQKIGAVLESSLQRTSITFAIQDGPESGQTVSHVHIHIIPRRKGDFKWNDDLYKELETEFAREARTKEEMSNEAKEFTLLFPGNEPIFTSEELQQIQNQ